MAINTNGINIENVVCNGVKMDKVILNGVEIFPLKPQQPTYLYMDLHDIHTNYGQRLVNNCTLAGDGTNIDDNGNGGFWYLYWINNYGYDMTFNISYTVSRRIYDKYDNDQGGICVSNDFESVFNQYRGLVHQLDCTTEQQTMSATVQVTVPNGHYLALWTNNHAVSTYTVTYA